MEETPAFVSFSQAKSLPQVGIQSPHSTFQYDVTISGKGNLDTCAALEDTEVKMEVDMDPGLQAPTHARKAFHMDDATVMEHVKAWTSSNTPRKAVESKKNSLLSRDLRPSERSADDYEGGLLDQFVGIDVFYLSSHSSTVQICLYQQSLSPQAFSGQPRSSHVSFEKSRTQDSAREGSEDELAIAKSTSLLSGSDIRTSEPHQLNTSRAGTPLNLPDSCSLVPVENSHLRVEDDAQTAVVNSSSRISTTEISNIEDITLSRYSLRRRQPNQLRPYLYDEFQYKSILKDNPAAIINEIRHKHRAYRQEDRYEEDDDYTQEESQHQDESRAQRKHSFSLVAQPLPPYIQPLSESDNSDSDDLAQEARRIERDRRRREREVREKEKEELKQKEEEKRWERQRLRREKEASRAPRRFPVSSASTSLGRRDSDVSEYL